MTYLEAMRALNDAFVDAVRAARKEDGAPVEALLELAVEVDCLIDYNCTRKELADAEALREGARQAGLTG
jgi:hypothetical protein